MSKWDPVLSLFTDEQIIELIAEAVNRLPNVKLTALITKLQQLLETKTK